MSAARKPAAWEQDLPNAVRLLEDFHGRAPRKGWRLPRVVAPEPVCAIGLAVRTDYWSSKSDPATRGPGQRRQDPEGVVGVWKLFTHEHDTSPFIYVPPTHGLVVEEGLVCLEWETLRDYATETVTWLGEATGYEFVPFGDDGESEDRTVTVEPSKELRRWERLHLWATSDARTMFLAPYDVSPDDVDEFVVWHGPGFRVTWEGIVG